MVYPEFSQDSSRDINTIIDEIYREIMESQRQMELMDAIDRFSEKYPWTSLYLQAMGRALADNPRYDLIEMAIKQVFPTLRKVVDLMKEK